MSTLEVIDNHIETQHSFPLSDLTPDNAEFLSLVLANQDVIRERSDIAARQFDVCSLTREPIMYAANVIYSQYTQTEALRYGMNAFWAIRSLVRARLITADLGIVKRNIAIMNDSDYRAELSSYFDRSVVRFENTLPATARVICTASDRHFPGSKNLALVGAALARGIDSHRITM